MLLYFGVYSFASKLAFVENILCWRPFSWCTIEHSRP